jgi:hypothetical protein
MESESDEDAPVVQQAGEEDETDEEDEETEATGTSHLLLLSHCATDNGRSCPPIPGLARGMM